MKSTSTKAPRDLNTLIKTNRMPIAEWADARGITEAEAARWLMRAGVKPSAKGMTPAQWKKLDQYVETTTGKCSHESLRS